MVNNKRIADFKQRIADTLATGELAYLQRMAEEFSRDHNVPAERVAAALAKMCLGEHPLLLDGKSSDSDRKPRKEKNKVLDNPRERKFEADDRPRVVSRGHEAGHDAPKRERPARKESIHTEKPKYEAPKAEVAKPIEHAESTKPAAEVKTPPVIDKSVKPESRAEKRRSVDQAAIEMERFRVEVGEKHGVKKENLVGAIANEAGLDAEFIGRITINNDHSLIELPSGMPKFLLKDLKRVWVCNEKLDISRALKNGERADALSETPKSKATRKPKVVAPVTEDADGETADLANDPGEQKAPREGKKKERHRNKKNKGKRVKT
jgi:ATP-dependent RNA helicase DeaD